MFMVRNGVPIKRFPLMASILKFEDDFLQTGA
jgi:hypothetical protein